MPTPNHPRKSLRDHLQHALPPYTGPYPVGFLELELPARQPRAFSPHIKRNDEYALKLDTVLFAVYYPADAPVNGRRPSSSTASSNTSSNPDVGRNHGSRSSTKRERRLRRKERGPLSRPPWLPRPRGSTCKGYAKFFSVPRVPVTAYMAVTSMFTKLPAYRNARLARGWSGEGAEEKEDGKEECGSGGDGRGQHSAETLVEGEGNGNRGVGRGEGRGKRGGGGGGGDDPPRFPVVILSHGLGGSRTLYSTICGELASFGLVVVAMEHRDGSGARTFVNKAGKAEDLESQGVAKTSGPPKHENAAPERRKKAEMKPHYKIDYLFPKGNAKDTAPQNPEGVDKELRAAQIEMRLAEVEEAFYVLGLINNGRGDRVRQDNLRKGDNIGSSSVGLDGVDWGDWIGRLDLESITMMGHSFGGATTVQALRSDRLTWITQGILLDPWGPATPECTEQKSVHKPVLSIGSEAFMYWAENFDCIEQICHEARASGTLSWMTTIRGSTHLSQTDFAVLYPNWMSLLIKTIVDPDRAIYLTVHSALEFLTVTLPHTQTRLIRTWPDGQLLRNARSETKVVSDHRPDDKWVAARLKIPNEFSTRLRSTLGRSFKGSTNQGAEAEIWCHQSPDRDSVERYMRRNHRLPVSTSPEGVIA